MPRSLVVLRIDDELDPSGRVPQEISRWQHAQTYWREHGHHRPDIILVDVNFEKDLASPLAEAAALEQHPAANPAGLLYALPMVAAARSNAQPIVVTFHTADPTLFAVERIKTGAPDPAPWMRSLAAQIVGLLAAMLGEQGTSFRSAEEAWAWLQGLERHAGEEAARAEALKQYRIRLVEALTPRPGSGRQLVVDPTGYQALLAWCTEMAKRGASPGDSEWEREPGISLIRADGSKDSIAVRSMFIEDDFAVDQFEVQEGAAGDHGLAWVSPAGEPLVGAFVHALGAWHRHYQTALDQLQHFTTGESAAAQRITEVVPSSEPGYRLTRFLILVLQVVRLHWNAEFVWRRWYTQHVWDPCDLRIQEWDQTETFEHSLQNWLKEAHGYLVQFADATNQELGGSPVTLVELVGDPEFRSLHGLAAEDTPGPDDSKCMQFHLDLLGSLGLCTRQVGKVAHRDWYVVSTDPFPDGVLPSLPESLEPDFIAGLLTGVARSLGIDKNPENPLRDIVGDALYPELETTEKRKRAGQFLQELNGGSVPPWVAALARRYAEDHLCWPENSFWPAFLRNAARTR